MNSHDIEEICQAYELGSPVSRAEPASGGRLHQVWRLQTTNGIFALKILNEKIMQKENICSAYEKTENVARIFASLGVPAVPALLSNGKCLNFVDNKAVMVFKWMEGEVHAVGTVEKQCAEKMGEVLGTIHGINLDAVDFMPVSKSVDPNEWISLLEQAKASKHPLVEILEANVSDLAMWSNKANTAAPTLQANLLLSHGDLDQHNVVWSKNTEPAIIDWESVGLQNPTVELLNLCLDWSGFPESVPCKEAFLSCYGGYQNSNRGRTALNQIDITLDGEIGYLLRWLSFSLKRSLDVSDGEREIAISESKNALRSLCLLDECRSLLRSWFVDETIPKND